MSHTPTALRVPFTRPDISTADVEAVAATVRSGWLTTGPRVAEFETEFSRASGAAHVVMLNSCTAALHLALDAIGLQPGDEVVIPSLTFAATAEVVCYFRATPVFADVRTSDHNLDPESFASCIGPRTKAVIPVHFGGTPCDMDEILAQARPQRIAVIADSAHCFPCDYRGRTIGTLADISCFSFYATKTITTGEGGALATDNQEWAERARTMSLHGMSRNAWKRYTDAGSWSYAITAAGYKYNMTDMAAALGLSQLKRASEMRDRRSEIAARYEAALAATDQFELLVRQPDRGNAFHLYVLKVRDSVLRLGRDEFIEELAARGIGTSVHFIPLHTQPFYSAFTRPDTDLAITDDVWRRSISLPIYSSMTDAEVDAVIEALLELAQKHKR
jgi:dTDP-4-amino-4,6-dideoxygalactose transaminase